MDLQLLDKWAIVCGASKGLGFACAEALAAEGVHLVINSRNRLDLEVQADNLTKKYGIKVKVVSADVTTAEGQMAILEACKEPDILVTNAGGPPPGDFRHWDKYDWEKALNANMLTPIFLIKGVIDGMIERRFGRIINITSSAVKAPIPILGLSNGARTGLTGFVAGLAKDVIQHNVTINNLLPGSFLTDRFNSIVESEAKSKGLTFDDILSEKIEANPAKRIGIPYEFGSACAFLCSANSGFITGQNIVIDGGAFPGTF